MKNVYPENFMDDKSTIFIYVDDEFYDYKFYDDYGLDYCTIEQMDEWGTIPQKIIEFKEC